jgi:hypothetical protein
MDEKGFMIGVLARSKRVFDKENWDSKEVEAALQDSSREWITLLASVCADGSALPPGLIYGAAGGAIQSSLVEDIDAEKHSEFFTSSTSGWTNNALGLAWLEQVFDRYTKKKARRSYRLLIIDGHGSHLTMDLSTTVTRIGSSWLFFLHVRPTDFSRLMWCCLSLYQLRTQLN